MWLCSQGFGGYLQSGSLGKRWEMNGLVNGVGSSQSEWCNGIWTNYTTAQQNINGDQMLGLNRKGSMIGVGQGKYSRTLMESCIMAAITPRFGLHCHTALWGHQPHGAQFGRQVFKMHWNWQRRRENNVLHIQIIFILLQLFSRKPSKAKTWRVDVVGLFVEWLSAYYQKRLSCVLKI